MMLSAAYKWNNDMTIAAKATALGFARVGACRPAVEEVLASLGHVAEGVYSAHTVVQRAHSLGVDMPIAQAVVSVLQAQVSPSQAVASLMGRDAKGE